MKKTRTHHWVRTAGQLMLSGIFMAVVSSFIPARAVGILPVPTFKDAHIFASIDLTADLFTYNYTIENPATNTGQIWYVKVDIRQPSPAMSLDATGLTVPQGSTRIPFAELVTKLQPLKIAPGTTLTSVGIATPTGWNGAVSRDGFAGFASATGTPSILPGQRLGGFRLLSRGVPAIRESQIVPDWVLNVEGEATLEEREQAAKVERDIRHKEFTLAPSAVPVGTYEHWNQLRDDLDKAVQLGWVMDTKLADTLKTQLASARLALDAKDGTLAKSRLQILMDTVSKATDAQRRGEVYGLVYFNAHMLIEATSDTPVPTEPKAELTPGVATLPVGKQHVLTARVVNVADNNKAMPNYPLRFVVFNGPHKGLSHSAVTDVEGKASFSYIGKKPGTDQVRVNQFIQIGALSADLVFGAVMTDVLPLLSLAPVLHAEARVTWEGGADLVVPIFIPPVIESAGGRTIELTEVTANQGTVASGASVTRYYLSPNPPPLDPATARVVGERAIPALDPVVLPEGLDRPYKQKLTLPADLPAGLYHLAACADAGGAVVELDEANNCSFASLQSGALIAIPVVSNNQPPDCGQASTGRATLWPPNHKLVPFAIQGVADPDGDPVSIRITGITQDEPVNGLGDGDTAPDATGVGGAAGSVRAERSGTGDGRIYTIGFTAEDGRGGQCEGAIEVGVPHNAGVAPVDDGQRYDSTSAGR